MKTGDGQRTDPKVWSGWGTALALTVVSLAVIASYTNSLSAPFVFDDIAGIVENPTIRGFSPWWQPLLPPHDGAAADGRPLVNLSLALNYAFGGLDTRGYHATNIAIHLLAMLLLFGVVRRTLARATLPPSLQSARDWVALATAGFWALHPLQTETVTCVVQRTESLGSLCYLGALYGFIRGTATAASAPRTWLAVGALACYAGVATKEIVATAPLLLLLYDRTFVAGSFRAAWRQHGWFHVAAFASWLPLAALMLGTQSRANAVGFSTGVTPWISLVTQSEAVAMYLKLSLWPHPLVVDYGRFVARSLAQVWPQFVLLAVLGGATLWALVRRPQLGFVGAWFFVILAPSSSFVPLLTQGIAEHRMYLPLAAIVLLGVLGLWRFAGRAAPWLCCALGAAAVAVTISRNHDYRDPIALWTNTIAQRPDNARAYQALAFYLKEAGDTTGAISNYQRSLELVPANFIAQLDLANVWLKRGDPRAAMPHIEAAARLVPRTSAAQNNVGSAFFAVREVARAVPFFEMAVRLDPTNVQAAHNLGYALAGQGNFAAAIPHFRRATETQPEFARAHESLGRALMQVGDHAQAQAALLSAARLAPGNAGVRLALGLSFAAQGRHAEAAENFAAAARLDPANVAAELNCGLALRAAGRPGEAVGHFQRVLQLDPRNEAAARMLAEMNAAASR